MSITTPQRTRLPGRARLRPTAYTRLLLIGGGLVVGVGVVVLSIAVGSNQLPFATVWHALVSPDDSYATTVVASRIPRTQLGMLAGAALAVSGAIIQALTRNPLGDPGLLGVNAGAAAAVVTSTAVFGVSAGGLLSLVAVLGAVLAAVVVYVVGSAGRSATPVRLVLAGAAVTAVLLAYIQAVTLTHPTVFATYRFWSIGSIAGQHPGTLATLWPPVVVGLIAAMLLARGLNTLSMGLDTAVALGARTGRIRLGAAAVATLLAGVTTAAVGPIAFVGLAVPHMVRPFTGGDQRWLIPASAVWGAVLVLGADVLGRVVARPGEIAVSLVVAVIGAPVLFLAVRRGGGA